MTSSEFGRIGIVGAGALGGLFGGYIKASGADVYLVDKNVELIEKINQDGLTINQPGGTEMTVHPTATTTPSDIRPVDVLFLFVKAIHTEAAIQDATPMLDDETIVVTVQNGLKNMEIIREYVPSEQVVGGTTTEGSSLSALAHVSHTGQGLTKIGGDNHDAAVQVANFLTTAGIETNVVENPESHIWEKQIVSVAIKPTAALTELLDGPLAEYDETTWVMEQLVDEAVAVAKAKGVELLSEDPLNTVREVCEVNYETKSSMLEDIHEHRKTEIDHINGAIVEYGEQEGIKTPYNRMAVALVMGKERSYLD